jgi:hypothetical protein
MPKTSPALCSSPSATCTFVLRLRREWGEDGHVWRGWIEHLPSGERAAVQDWEGVEAFVRRFGVGVEGGGRSVDREPALSAAKGRRAEHGEGEGDVVE